MKDIVSVKNIPPEYRNTPAGLLLEYHNLDMPFAAYEHPQLLIGTCMDFRVRLRIPERFAFVLRTGGANMQGNEFRISFAIAVGGVRQMALIGHTDCGMSDLQKNREKFIEGLSAGAGWDPASATEHFERHAPASQIGEETAFILSEARRLRKLFPKITIVPMLYRVEDNRLYLISEDQ